MDTEPIGQLAHQLGHAMNLDHSDGRENLMFNADVETGLTDHPRTLRSEQSATARQ